MYTVARTWGESLSVDADGNIGRPAIGMKPSGQWKALGLVRRNNFGHVVQFIPFATWPQHLPTEWRYKNGKPIYTMRDLDHGTVREWGSPQVAQVYCD